ncbi:MAG: DUF1330 domain-containing protein [Pseudomonadota bacterium]
MSDANTHGLWIAHVTVKDLDRYGDYLAAASPVFARYGAVFQARGGRYEPVEGISRDRHIIIQFPTYDAALACYQDPEYQEAARIRMTAAETEIVIVEGVAQT